jgi:hypothetical protein
MVNCVADTVGMMNPNRTQRWTDSKVHFFSGILGLDKVKVPAIVEGCSKRHTSTLHFKFSWQFNHGGQTVPAVSIKATHDAPWSEVFFPFKEDPSGLSLADIPKMRLKPVAAVRLKEINDGLDSSQFRISVDDHHANTTEYEILKNKVSRAFHWPRGGKFQTEQEFTGAPANDDGHAATTANQKDGLNEMPPVSRVTSVHTTRVRRVLRNLGREDLPETDIIHGNLVVFYLPDGVDREFGIGRILATNDVSRISIRWWNNPTKNHNTGWRPYNAAGKHGEVLREHILFCRSLDNMFTPNSRTSRGRRGLTLMQGHKDRIKAGIHRVKAKIESSNSEEVNDEIPAVFLERKDQCEEDVGLQEVQ